MTLSKFFSRMPMRTLSTNTVSLALLLAVTPRIVVGESPTVLEQRQIPEQVRRWVKENRPQMAFPPIEYFFGGSFREQDLGAFLKKKRGWPPYCIGADFNGDKRTDYALILFKPIDSGGVSYNIIILHAGKAGLTEISSPIKHTMGNVEYYIDTRLVVLPKGKHLGGTVNVAHEIFLKQDSISIAEGYSQYYFVWTKDGYKERALSAD